MADQKPINGPVVVFGARVPRQWVTDAITSPCVKINDAIDERKLALKFHADMDMVDLLDIGNSILFVTEVAVDQVGVADEKLDWQVAAYGSWTGGRVREDRTNKNPGLCTIGGIKGMRARTTMKMLGKPINVGGDYTAGPQEAVPAAPDAKP